jgi:Penicillin amidase
MRRCSMREGCRLTGTLVSTSGNSFVALVQFGARPKAWAVVAGGQSGDTRSSHFANHIERYAGGKLCPIYLETADLKGARNVPTMADNRAPLGGAQPTKSHYPEFP